MPFNIWPRTCMRFDSAGRAATSEDLLHSACQARLLWSAARRPINRFGSCSISKMATHGGHCSTSLMGTNIIPQAPHRLQPKSNYPTRIANWLNLHSTVMLAMVSQSNSHNVIRARFVYSLFFLISPLTCMVIRATICSEFLLTSDQDCAITVKVLCAQLLILRIFRHLHAGLFSIQRQYTPQTGMWAR